MIIIDSIFQNPIFSIIGIIGGIASVIGIPLAIIIPKKLAKHNPKYTILSKTIRKKDFTNNTFVKIQSNGKDVPTLTISKIAFWNNGASLRPSDIAPNAPICIKTKKNDIEILEFQKVFSENKNNIRNIQISKDSKSITFDFDFFAKNEGMVLNVFHTGNSSKDIEVDGSLINGEHVTKSKKNVHFYSKKTRLLFSIMLIISIITICLYIIVLKGSIFLGTFGILGGFIVLVYSIIKIIPPMPSKLAKYYSDEIE